MKLLVAILLNVMLAAGVPRAAAKEPLDLESVASEQNLEKRARKALEYAHETVGRVVDAYREGDDPRGVEMLSTIQEAVELAQASLVATGKNAFKKPKHFKRAEIETRKLLRELDDIEKEISFDQRDTLDEVRTRITEINEDLLMSIMTKNKQ